MEFKIWILYLYVLWTPSSFSFNDYYFEDSFAPDTNGKREEAVPCSGSGPQEKHKTPVVEHDNSAQDLVKDLRAILRSIRNSAQQILNDVSDLQVELAADESQMVSDRKNTTAQDKEKEKGKDKSKDGEVVMTEFGIPSTKTNGSEKPCPVASSIVESSLISNEMMRSWDEQINACKTLLDTAKKGRSNAAKEDIPIEKKDDKINLFKTVRSLRNFIKVNRDPGPSGEVIQNKNPDQPETEVEKEKSHINPWNVWLKA